jgi:signal transduction histidine kinase
LQKDPPAAHVAIIDDDDDARATLEHQLKRAGYEVTGYDRADIALAELQLGAAPDLIVLDLMMPGMNGWQFRVEQRNCPKLCDVPVVALSGDVSPYAKAVDADAYLTKPVGFEALEAVIGRVLVSSERRRLLAKSVELERVRALGMLVASVAHEINNPLTGVVGCLELAAGLCRELESLGLGEPGARVAKLLSQNLADAADGAARIASVVKQLSTFSRAEAADSDDVDVLRAVQAASRLVRHRIDLHAHFDEDLTPVPHVIGNEARLAQVVLNLLVNAAQAVSSCASAAPQVRLVTRQAGATVEIEVSDTGPGIDPKLLPHIFEPFFTTKPDGMGTGLGLSISRDIIASMAGTLNVRSVPGQGATFTITLPIASRI